MVHRVIRSAATLLVGLGLPLVSQAALIVYTSQASFLAAVNSAATDTFNDLALGFVASPLPRMVGSYGYTASATNGLYAVGTSADEWLSTNNATDPIVFASFTGGVSAIGGYFFNTDFSGNLQTGRNVTVAAADGSGTLSQLLSNTTATTFLGFISDGLITSLTVTADNSQTDPNLEATWPTVNDLILAKAGATQPPVTPVPEPGTLALLGLAAAGLGLVHRRRQ